MFRKSVISLVLCLALLLIVFGLAAAQRLGGRAYQDSMATPTAMALAEPTPSLGLPLSDEQAAPCPMMSGSGAYGMQGTFGISGMQGMQGMSGMSGMQGMSGMNMAMNGSMMNYYVTPWYYDPWYLLGWALLALVMIVILMGVVFGVKLITQPSKPNPPANLP